MPRTKSSRSKTTKDRAANLPAIARPTSSLRAIQLLTPPVATLRAFGSLVDPIYARCDQAKKVSRTLAALRDSLLPKLISGELRVA